MTRMGFLLDSDNCIGCHACTVACKSEHDVPLGVNRTWVKYIETGTFPDVARKFNVMRCNQCDDAPCMTICPTSALFRADNGVVDFQDDDCIGCKSCMNACPYDALYINPETNTAHKCNMCNHRLEVGLEPSCQIVCPTEAIKIGDLDDPTSEISRIIARDDVAVRSPEQNTKPKVFYRGADQASLDPTRTAIANDGLIWADTLRGPSGPRHPTVPVHLGNRPIDESGVVARTAYTTSHQMTWKAKVAGYLVTKAVAAGVMVVAALLVLLGHSDDQAAVGVVPPMIAGAFLGLTGVLLVWDLKQPSRFHYLLTKGNRSSWLVKGAYILMAFAAVCAIWWIAGLTETAGLLEVLAVPAVIGAAGTAGYTAYLFAQCEGRDLWQTPLLLPVLLGQAVTAGGAAYAVLDVFMAVPEPDAIRWVLLGGVAAVAMFVAIELSSHGSRHVELAVESMTRGVYSRQFWWGGVVLGLLVPAALVIVSLAADLDGSLVPALAGLAALIGMFAYEDAFVRAGQSVPLS
ncbi:MAG TPA: 4Fe-4S dicluster domain-containing protein [Acidimicrobiales bacterium]|nr:4Fe-4S dicluster domain-containing protein [Acidimicrobiales bacterium]